MEEKTIEDYCRLIDKLDSGKGVRSTNISKGLGLSKNTVATTLHKLSIDGYVEMPHYGPAKLSNKGLVIAKKMNFKHRVLETFLFSKLGMNKDKVHTEACRMEHFVSDEMIARLYLFMKKPKTDPHGREIV